MADAYDVALAPHCPIGPLGFVASLHIDACCPNALVQEQILFKERTLGLDWEGYLENPSGFQPENGFVKLPPGPGLGLEINEDVVRERSEEEFTYDRGIERLPDGSIIGS